MVSWIEINGTCIRYARRPGAGRRMVLVHEMGGSLESWDSVVALLPPDADILYYDARGAGLSEKMHDGCTIDTHVDDLHALRAAVGFEGPAVLMGIAVGAAICIRYAARFPDCVSHLLALAPACGVAPEQREATRQRARKIAAEGMRGDAAAVFERAFPAALRTDPAAFATYRCRWFSTDPRSLGALYAMLADLDLTPDLPLMPRRSVFVAGTHDALRPPAEIDRLASFAPQIEALHVPSGHFMAIHSPRLLAELLTRYAAEDTTAASIYAGFRANPEHHIGDVGHAA
ncbi:alpha/beta hydrolase [Acidovorax sp. D2M1]|uniref:Alpha/beta hydrolase n=1 Tax=Acidovorax benzenivorans TaxID=2987520 RepID=A0ABT5S0U5_9BURK|nr:alpha/beta hydrolase [Acidovorax benzenivorans]MDD2179275.1 alpha/beta hydrolase [Acidovorax benzenivorans]